MVNVTSTNTRLFTALGFKMMGKAANPSLVVIAVTVSVVPSGQWTMAVPVAPSTPTGFWLTVWVNLAKMLIIVFGLSGLNPGEVLVSQAPQ